MAAPYVMVTPVVPSPERDGSAPTGGAARQLSERIQEHASTLDKVTLYRPDGTTQRVPGIVAREILKASDCELSLEPPSQGVAGAASSADGDDSRGTGRRRSGARAGVRSQADPDGDGSVIELADQPLASGERT